MLCLLGVLGGASPARADDDPAGVPEPEVSNPRTGFAIGLSLGGRRITSFDVKGAGGNGGVLALRVGTSAAENLWWMLQFQATTEPQDISGGGNDQVLNQYVSLTLGVQYYMQQYFWLRGGAGLTALFIPGDSGAADQRSTGLAFTGAGGYDIFSRGIFALALELGVSADLYPGEGSIVGIGLGLAAHWY